MLNAFRAFLLILAAFVLSLGGVAAREPPSHPVLRIETGVHGADITGLAVDRDGKLMVTSSYDKTLRLWSIADRTAPPRVLRVPIDLTREGKLYAVALSPDGRYAATAGWTGEWDDPAWSLYIFDVASGRVTHRVGGLPHRVVSIAFSHDGRYLALGLKFGKGLLVLDSRNWTVFAQDEAYTDDIPSLDFDRNGRLVAVALDGTVSLYDPDFRRTRRIKAPGGAQTAVARFAPDGRTIAIGYLDAARVDLVSADELQLIRSADTRGVERGFIALAWSRDGAFLYGAGRYERGGRHPIRRWSAGGTGQARDIPVAHSIVTQIVALEDGGLAYATAGAAFGVLDKSLRTVWERKPAAADFRDQRDTLRVSDDGGEVEFSFERFGASPVSFSLAQRTLITDRPNGARLSAALAEVPEVMVGDWRDSERPTLDGRLLPLLPHETSISLAVAPDQKSFVLGTAWRVIAFDSGGVEQWSVPAPGVAWAVNVTGNGRLAIAAFGDGTIRWLRMKDGKELLALFPHADGRRWVAWTPSGYYAASPGGDTLIGWHVNRGKDTESDFFTVSRFRDNYYRPDVVEKVLGTLDEGTAIHRGDVETGRSFERRALSELLPPVVTVLSPADGKKVMSPKVTIEYEVRPSANIPIRKIYFRADGRLIAEVQPRQPVLTDGGRGRMTVYVPRRDSLIEVIAENIAGAVSEPSAIRVRWDGPPSNIKPTLYVLAVGISAYRSPKLVLNLAAKDAQDFAGIVSRQKGRAFRDVQVRTLIDAQATGDALREALNWLANVPTYRDVAILFMAGHGVDDPMGRYFFVPQELEPEEAMSRGLSYLKIRQALGRIAGRAFFFIDTCYSGAIWGRPTGSAVDVSRIVNDLSSPEQGVVVFASSTGRQLSYENLEWGNGAFTKAVIEGLTGRADFFGNGYVTVAQLDAYVSDRVPKLTAGRQTPAIGKPVNADFRLVELR